MKRFLNIIRKIFYFLVLLIFITVLGLYATGNGYVVKGFRLTYLQGNTTANIYDADDFDNRVILAQHPQSWNFASPMHAIPEALDKKLSEDNTVAFLVIKNDSVVVEKYYDGHDEKKVSNSFSMAKSVTSLLMFFAIQDGFIKGTEQKASDFLPQFNATEFGKKLTVGDLSRMTAGLDWDESYYSPFNVTTESYYGDELEKLMQKVSVSSAPNQEFHYQSGATELLGMVIKKATGKTLSAYVQEKLWIPLGMESDALWTIDQKDGIEKTFCCINATARDFAKLGQFVLQKGKWNGVQLLDSKYIETMTQPYLSPQYGYGFWMDHQYKPALHLFQGHLGQFIIIVPEKNAVIVRLGNGMESTYPAKNLVLNDAIYYYTDQGLKCL